MTSTNQDLIEAVDRLRDAEKSFLEIRQEVADLFCTAARNQQVTQLSIMTGINRTTIYWLMRTWSTNANSVNGNNR